MKSDPKLRKWFLAINRSFFDGQLPLETRIWWQPCGTSMGVSFEIEPAKDGKPAILGITIDPCLAGLPRLTKVVIAHECCHVKLWPITHLVDHGRKFDEEIQRLCTFRKYRKWL